MLGARHINTRSFAQSGNVVTIDVTSVDDAETIMDKFQDYFQTYGGLSLKKFKVMLDIPHDILDKSMGWKEHLPLFTIERNRNNLGGYTLVIPNMIFLEV